MKYTILNDRGVVAVSGSGAVAFLQNLITNDMTQVVNGYPIYAALLSPQGKYLFDFFVLFRGGKILLECEMGRLNDLVQRLRLYRLRDPIEIEDVSESFQVAAGFGEKSTEVILRKTFAANTLEIAGGMAFIDPRVAMAGIRVVANNPGDKLADWGFAHCDYDDYESHRLALALPRASSDLVVNRSFLLESNFDYLNGIDFDKGCFVGQEVTARTKYRGLVRRRLFGVYIDGDVPPLGTSIEVNGKHAGTMMSGFENLGLALLKVEVVGKHFGLNRIFKAGKTILKPWMPEWFGSEKSQ